MCFFSLSTAPSTKPTHKLSTVRRQRWGRGVCPSPVLLSQLLAPAHHPQPLDSLALAHHPQTSLPGLMGASSTSSPWSSSSQPRLWGRERQAERGRQAGRSDAQPRESLQHVVWGQGIFPAQSLWPQYDQMAPLELPKSHPQHSARAHKANSHHARQPPRLTRQTRVLM